MEKFCEYNSQLFDFGILSYLLNIIPKIPFGQTEGVFKHHEPSIDIFKLALLNKFFHRLILDLFMPLKLSQFGDNYGLNKFIDLMSNAPNLDKEFVNSIKDVEKYRQNEEYKSNILEGFKQKHHGGSIFRPIWSIRKLKKNESPIRPNSLFN